MSWINVNDYHHPEGWAPGIDSGERTRWYCEQLEQGQILFFQSPPFSLPKEDLDLLLSQPHTESRYHKNVSYRPQRNAVRGAAPGSDANQLQQIMQRYSTHVTQFLAEFLLPYASSWSLDFASFRPLEEKGRNLPLHKRNDLLHVDSFPSRPTRGGRILRVFTNISLSQPRIWNVTDRFDVLAERYAVEAGLNKFSARASSPLHGLRRQILRTMHAAGMPIVGRSPYDEFMLHFHDYLKENSEFQSGCVKTRLEFPPQSTWIVFTDGVPHAALSGQFALEHTYIVPLSGLVSKHKAPIRVLEAICEQPLSV